MVKGAYVDSINGKRKGEWSEEEDHKLSSYILKYGIPNWRLLPAFADVATGKSCRLRWVNYLDPAVKRGNYTQQEDNLIIQLHHQLGNKWFAIAKRLPGRTDNDVKNRWHAHLSTRGSKRRKNNIGNSSGGIMQKKKKEKQNKQSSHEKKNQTSRSCCSWEPYLKKKNNQISMETINHVSKKGQELQEHDDDIVQQFIVESARNYDEVSSSYSYSYSYSSSSSKNDTDEQLLLGCCLLLGMGSSSSEEEEEEEDILNNTPMHYYNPFPDDEDEFHLLHNDFSCWTQTETDSFLVDAAETATATATAAAPSSSSSSTHDQNSIWDFNLAADDYCSSWPSNYAHHHHDYFSCFDDYDDDIYYYYLDASAII